MIVSPVHQFTPELRVKFISLNVNSQTLTSFFFFSSSADYYVRTMAHAGAHPHTHTHTESETSVAQAGPAVAAGDCGPSKPAVCWQQVSPVVFGLSSDSPRQLTRPSCCVAHLPARLELRLRKHFRRQNYSEGGSNRIRWFNSQQAAKEMIFYIFFIA